MLSKKTILIVEDEDAILLALQRILELTGSYEVAIAQDGQKAQEVLKTVIPDLIISDISMPNMNGLEFCQKVRENPVTKSIPFVFLTAKKEKMIEGITAGGDDFLMKPFNVDEVLVKIEAIFRRIEQSREQASQHKGRIEDMPFESILELCLREKISGELILNHEGDVGVVQLENGDIVKVTSNTLTDDEALDTIRQWKMGTFVIRPIDINLKVDSLTRNTETDIGKALKLSEDVWWVGAANAEEKAFHNTYLRLFNYDDKQINALIDPGSPLYFNEISDKIGEVLSDISKVNIYIPMSGQPDVCLNSLFLRKSNQRVICMTGKKTWETLRHYEINPRSVKQVDIKKSFVVKLASGHQLQFLATPFCNTADSFITYDIEKRVLFSGILFGSDGYEDKDFNTVFAGEQDWDHIRMYHQKNCASGQALKSALHMIKRLDPSPLCIAPRYGKLLRSEQIPFFLERLLLLNVGMDLQIQDNLKENGIYVDAVNTLLNQIQSAISLESSILKIKQNAQLAANVSIENNRIENIFSAGSDFYLGVTKELMRLEDQKTANQIKSAALKIAYSAGINVPDLQD